MRTGTVHPTQPRAQFNRWSRGWASDKCDLPECMRLADRSLAGRPTGRFGISTSHVELPLLQESEADSVWPRTQRRRRRSETCDVTLRAMRRPRRTGWKTKNQQNRSWRRRRGACTMCGASRHADWERRCTRRVKHSSSIVDGGNLDRAGFEDVCRCVCGDGRRVRGRGPELPEEVACCYDNVRRVRKNTAKWDAPHRTAHKDVTRYSESLTVRRRRARRHGRQARGSCPHRASVRGRRPPAQPPFTIPAHTSRDRECTCSVRGHLVRHMAGLDTAALRQKLGEVHGKLSANPRVTFSNCNDSYDPIRKHAAARCNQWAPPVCIGILGACIS